MRSLILVFCLFGLALSTPQYYSSELEGLSESQQQSQQQQQQQQQQVDERQGVETIREEAERRRLNERLGRRVESEESAGAETPRREAVVILRPTVSAASESELYDGRGQEQEQQQQQQDRSAVPGTLLRPHHTRSHKLAARLAVRRVLDVQDVPVQQQQQQQQQQSGNDEEETTTAEPLTTPAEEQPSTTTEEESTTTSTEEPSNDESERKPEFVSDAAAVVNSRTFTTFKARKNVKGKQVTVMGRTMAFRSSVMNVLRPLIRRHEDDANESDDERREREKAEAAAKNVKIVQYSQVQAIKSTKAVITRDAPTF